MSSRKSVAQSSGSRIGRALIMSRAPRVCLVQVGGSDQLSTRTPTSSCQDFVTWQYGEFEPFFWCLKSGLSVCPINQSQLSPRSRSGVRGCCSLSPPLLSRCEMLTLAIMKGGSYTPPHTTRPSVTLWPNLIQV